MANSLNISYTDLYKNTFYSKPEPYDSTTALLFNDNEECFQVLLNLYMEAMMDYERLISILTGTIQPLIKTPLDLNNINISTLELPTRWFVQLGYNLHISKYDSIDDYPFENYCEILLKANPADYSYFEYKQIDKDFHFILNGDVDPNTFNSISDYKAILLYKKSLYNIYFTKLSI